MSEHENASSPKEQPAVRTTIVGGRPPGCGKGLGEIPRGIEVLVKKASVDPAFRALLLRVRAEAAKEIGLTLSAAETAMLAVIPAAQLEAVVDRTHVDASRRPAFLGKAAAVMLVALGANAITGCNDSQNNAPPPQTQPAPITKPTDTPRRTSWGPESDETMIIAGASPRVWDMAGERIDVPDTQPASPPASQPVPQPDTISGLSSEQADVPKGTKWICEFPDDVELPPLPKELQDLLKDLLEEEEDLFDDVEDTIDPNNFVGDAIGWDTLEGPISNIGGVAGVRADQVKPPESQPASQPTTPPATPPVKMEFSAGARIDIAPPPPLASQPASQPTSQPTSAASGRDIQPDAPPVRMERSAGIRADAPDPPPPPPGTTISGLRIGPRSDRQPASQPASQPTSQPATQPATAEEVAELVTELIKKLDDDSRTVRDDADKRLSDLMPGIQSQLEEALKNDKNDNKNNPQKLSAEQRVRIEQILERERRKRPEEIKVTRGARALPRISIGIRIDDDDDDDDDLDDDDDD